MQDGYPFETEGRDDGVMYWGQFDKVKFSIGAFDVTGLTTGDSDVLLASRVQVDFWDAEDGYYLNGTYYGEKDLLAIGLAAQTADAGEAYTFDFLLEKKLGNSGVITVESEYARVRRPRRLSARRWAAALREVRTASTCSAPICSAARPVPASSRCSPSSAQATYDFFGDDLDQDTLEFDLNYLIKTFNARISLYYLDKSFDPDVGGDTSTIGLGLQIQM